MAYLTSGDICSDLKSMQSWQRPGEIAMQIHIDLASDRLIVQFEFKGILHGVVFGSYQTTTEDVHFMLDKGIELLRQDVQKRMATMKQPNPPWVTQSLNRLKQWWHNEEDLVAVERLLKETGIDNMPDMTPQYRVSGIPTLTWRTGSRQLKIETDTRGRFNYSRKLLGEGETSGRVETDTAHQLRDLLLWVRDGIQEPSSV